MEILITQILLGVLLFFIINWIGKHSYSIGYIEISLFVRTEEAPALNFLIRVVAPIVYIILVSTLFYSFGRDEFVKNIYFVNIYYIAFRLTFNLITQRGLLLNWYRQILYWISIITISYYTYEKIIKYKTNVLPDFTTLANELWVIIIIFVFQIANNIRLGQDSTKKRKDHYLKVRYNYFRHLYGRIIREKTQNELLESLAYAILIYEDFNRPRIARFIERIVFVITKKPRTLGVMQVYTRNNITDLESVNLGVDMIYTSWLQAVEKYKTKPEQVYGDWIIYDEIICNYNGGPSYKSEISDLTMLIKNTFYQETKDVLFTRKNCP